MFSAWLLKWCRHETFNLTFWLYSFMIPLGQVSRSTVLYSLDNELRWRDAAKPVGWGNKTSCQGILTGQLEWVRWVTSVERASWLWPRGRVYIVGMLGSSGNDRTMTVRRRDKAGMIGKTRSCVAGQQSGHAEITHYGKKWVGMIWRGKLSRLTIMG